MDIDKHINNLSSYRLRSFLEKLVLCRGLQFAIPQPTCSRDIQATFEKAYCKLEPLLLSDSKNSVDRKSTNTGVLLHYHSYVDKRYKGCLLSTMINRTYRLSSTPTAFSEECDKLRTTFLNLDYPVKFLPNIDNITALDDASDGTPNIVVPLPFKDQHSANSIKREMQNLSTKIGVQIEPVFQSKSMPPKNG